MVEEVQNYMKPEAEGTTGQIVLAQTKEAESAREVGSATGIIDLNKKQELEVLFAETVNNPRFWAKENRVKALTEAMVIPVFDDKSLQQFFNHAMDDLTNTAAKESVKTRQPVVMPTEEEGKKLAWSRYIIQAKKQIVKKLKKEGKEVSEEAITKLLEAELDTLSDKQNA